MQQPPLTLKEIESKIYLIRGRKVMMDSDLATLYGVTTFNLNKAVRRNIVRFPSDFMFQLTNQEVSDLIFQIGISKVTVGRGGRRHHPYVFTQEGVAMLSSVLRSNQAVEVNIYIMRAFVRLREMTLGHDDLSRRIDQLEERYDTQFGSVFDVIREMIAEHAVPRKKIRGLSSKKD